MAFAGAALGGVETDELYLGAKAKAVKQAVFGARISGGARLLNRRAQIEIVINLRAIKALLHLALVVVTDGGKDGHAIDDVTVGLKIAAAADSKTYSPGA